MSILGLPIGTQTEFKVLDHGYVRYVAHLGTDETVVEAARMSTDKGFQGWGPVRRCPECGSQEGPQGQVIEHNSACSKPDFKMVPGDEKLLEYLYSHGHSTPFEMCELAIEVQAPIFVFREWQRHRTQSFSELSARYTQMPNLHYVPEQQRFSANWSANKQASSAVLVGDGTPNEELQRWVRDEQREVYDTYEGLLESGVAREVARINTPVSRYSRMRAKTDLRNWLGFLKLRLEQAAQFEIRCYAQAVASIVKSLWPRTYALFEEYDLHGVRLSRSDVMEMKELFRGERCLPREGTEFRHLSEGFLGKFK